MAPAAGGHASLRQEPPTLTDYIDLSIGGTLSVGASVGRLRTAVPPIPETAAALVQKNRAIFERLTAIGGKPYPVDAVPLSAADWRRQPHPFWKRFEQAKRRFDPDGILTPGQGIF